MYAKLIAVCLFGLLADAGNVMGQVRQIIRQKKEPDPVMIQKLSPVKMLPNPTVLLVLGSRKFESAIQPFLDHKNKVMRLPAAFIDIESLRNYSGVDEPEKIKRAIAEAALSKSVRYVMLIGDAALFPVRHRYVSNGNELGRPSDPKINSGWWFDGGYNPTDHYYANLFHHQDGGLPGDFDNWDADGDGRYNEQVWQWQGTGDDQAQNVITYNPDQVDGYPDIAVGRLPVHSPEELTGYIQKVILYETSGQFRKRNLSLLAGASYPGSGSLADQVLYYNNYALQQYVGEPGITRMQFNAMSTGFGPWEPANFATIRNAALKSWGMIYVGHGYNLGWEIRDNDSCYYDQQGNVHWVGNRPGNFDDGQVNQMLNRQNLPVIFSIGCETGQFKPNIPTHAYYDINGTQKWYWVENNKVKDNLTKQYYTQLPLEISKPSAYDLGWMTNRTFACSWLINPNQAGGIAFFGETVVCENYHARDLISRVLYSYTTGKKILGDIWLEGQQQYWRDYRFSTNVFHHPRIYLSIMTFYGDPSLQIQ